MFAENRQKEIYDYIQKYGSVTTSYLMQTFQVSVETIRRDLLTMEKQGLLKRVHGGAVEFSNMKKFSSLKERNKEFTNEKRKLSLNAVSFVQEGDIIFIDEGSTAVFFAQAIKERFSDLTVVTHSLDVFNILCNHQGIKVILCGGYFIREENAFYGNLVLDALSKIYVQKAFIFPSAVSIEFGICDYQEDLYQIQKQMLNSADQIFILADSSKFEKRAFLQLSDMKSEYIYVTDDKLPDELEMLYKKNKINVFREKRNE